MAFDETILDVTSQTWPIPPGWIGRDQFTSTQFRSACVGHPCNGQCDYRMEYREDMARLEESFSLLQVFPSNDWYTEMTLRVPDRLVRESATILSAQTIATSNFLKVLRTIHPLYFANKYLPAVEYTWRNGVIVPNPVMNIVGPGGVRTVESPRFTNDGAKIPQTPKKAWEPRFQVGQRVRVAKTITGVYDGRIGTVVRIGPEIGVYWTEGITGITSGFLDSELEAADHEASSMAAYLTMKIVPQKRFG